jgi:transcriptional regulator
VSRLTQRHEAQFEKQWSVDDAPPDYIESMLKAIVGIEVQITSIEAKRKLSQNKPPADIAGIADGLARVGGASATIADAMRAL